MPAGRSATTPNEQVSAVALSPYQKPGCQMRTRSIVSPGNMASSPSDAGSVRQVGVSLPLA